MTPARTEVLLTVGWDVPRSPLARRQRRMDVGCSQRVRRLDEARYVPSPLRVRHDPHCSPMFLVSSWSTVGSAPTLIDETDRSSIVDVDVDVVLRWLQSPYEKYGKRWETCRVCDACAASVSTRFLPSACPLAISIFPTSSPLSRLCTCSDGMRGSAVSLLPGTVPVHFRLMATATGRSTAPSQQGVVDTRALTTTTRSWYLVPSDALALGLPWRERGARPLSWCSWHGTSRAWSSLAHGG